MVAGPGFLPFYTSAGICPALAAAADLLFMLSFWRFKVMKLHKKIIVLSLKFFKGGDCRAGVVNFVFGMRNDFCGGVAYTR